MSKLYASMGLVPLVPYDVCPNRPMGQAPYVLLRTIWDRSHVCLQGSYGTGPICDPQTPRTGGWGWVVKIRMNEMAHSIPAGMKWPIPFRPE